MAHVLDSPFRAALTTRHGNLAEGGPLALRYRLEISPFAAVVDEGPDGLAAMASLIEPDGSIMVSRAGGGHPVPPGTTVEHEAAVVQMCADSVSAPDKTFSFGALSDDDAPEMLALAELTKPGPYRARSHLFGGYIGMRHDGKLVAMAGERLKAPGFTEVSAVCTHPDFRGRGYGSFLLLTVAARIQARGETPFLHVYANNVNAIRLYEALGFTHRADVVALSLRRS